MLNEKEKNELKDLEKSSKLREDMQALLKTRHNPFLVNGNVDSGKLLMFLVEYNYFINHNRRPLRRIIDKDMRL